LPTTLLQIAIDIDNDIDNDRIDQFIKNNAKSKNIDDRKSLIKSLAISITFALMNGDINQLNFDLFDLGEHLQNKGDDEERSYI
jgi:hypothetical protein